MRFFFLPVESVAAGASVVTGAVACPAPVKPSDTIQVYGGSALETSSITCGQM